MVRGHRTAVLLGSLTACAPGADPDARVEVRPHWWPRCVPSRPPGEVTLGLEALGDFDPTPATAESFDEDSPALELGIPPQTRAVRLTARDGFGAWRGIGDRAAEGPLHVSLWPEGEACVLHEGDDDYPGPHLDQAVGVGSGGEVLVFGGGTSTASATSALSGDLDEARIDVADLDPRSGRAGARVTRFAGSLLVSGGTDPRADGAPLASAEVLDPGTGRFDPSPIALSAPRADHGAVALPTGETLLVGGRGASGSALATLELVLPAERRFRIAGLADLETARIDPRVLVLTDGSVVVAGGVNDAGEPVGSVEWLTPDASGNRRTLASLETDGVAVVGRAFAPMPGGGFIAAGGCSSTAPPPARAADCATLCGPGAGCPATSAVWVAADGTITPLPGAVPTGAPRPTLVAGEPGRPWLATGDPETPRLLRLDPWTDPSGSRPWFAAPASTARTVPSGRATVVAADSGALLWLERPPPGSDEPAALYGLRHAARGAFATDVAPLVSGGAEHLSPDAPTGERLRYDAATRTLHLDHAGAHVSVTGTTFEDVGLAVTRCAGPAPIVTLGSLSVGSVDCPWPATPGGAVDFRLARRGDQVEVAVGGRRGSCDGPAGRVELGLETSGPGLVVAALTVRRAASIDFVSLGGGRCP